MGTLWQDVRYGVRMLARSPGFSVIVVALVAIGVGASTTVFSILNPILLRPLPYQDPDRIVCVEGRTKEGHGWNSSYPDFLDWRRQTTCFEELSCYQFRDRPVGTTGDELLEECSVGSVSGNFFRVFSVQPTVGRFFLETDDQPGAAPVAVISHAFWQRRFAADPNVVGKSVLLGDSRFTIRGVTPASFRFLPFGEPSGDVWVAAGRTMTQAQRGDRNLCILGRLKAGVTIARTQAEMDTVCGRLAAAYPSTNTGLFATLTRLHDYMKGLAGPAFGRGSSVLMGAVLMVFLVACANAAGLTFARGVNREREMALRSALGGTRLQLARLMLLEDALLALLGGGLGVLGAVGAIRLLLGTGLLPSGLFPADFFRVDGRVLGFALALSILGAPACGLIASVYCSGVGQARTLAEGARSVLGLRSRNAVHAGLLATQVALTLVLLVTGGLMMRSVVNVIMADRGFDPEGVLVVDVRSAGDQYAGDESKAAFHRQLLDRLGSLPGIEKVGLTWPLFAGWNWYVYAEGQPVPLPGEGGTPATYKAVSPAYFETMRIRLLQGRFFDERDGVGSPRVVIVDETLARRCWPEGPWIGRRVKTDRGTDPNSPWAEVVGVVGHVKNDVDTDTSVQVYKPILQDARVNASVVLRTKGDPKRFAGAVPEAIHQVDHRQLVSNVRTLDEELWYRALVRRLVASLIGAFAAIALFLSAVGIYAITRYSVSRRTQEFGIRMALGAKSSDVLREVFRRSLTPVWVGSALGLAGTMAVARVLSGLLYEVSPWDPTTYIAVSLLLGGVALLAGYLPARRAARIDPMVALRYE
jgi:putative ABC transport system permease protein